MCTPTNTVGRNDKEPWTNPKWDNFELVVFMTLHDTYVSSVPSPGKPLYLSNNVVK